MKSKKLNDAELHSAGATVRHKSPFESLNSHKNEDEITQEFREKWVIPFYLKLRNRSDEWLHKMINVKPQITDDIILQNLGDFDWRTRSTGSYFALIKESYHLEDIIGIHLLKSEVCSAGGKYALTLASFNTAKSVQYLNRYLEYYLIRPDLYFDQGVVMVALKYLDEVNETNNLAMHLKNWEDYLNWRYHDQIKNMNNLKEIVPDKAEELEREIQELKPKESKIDTTHFHESIEFLNKIINE